MSLLQAQRSCWRPDHPAIVVDGQAITYGELDQRIARAAAWLTARGLVAGDIIALQLSRSPSFLEVHLAALGLGITTLPLNPAYTASELQFYLNDSNARLACVLDDAVQGLAGLASKVMAESQLRSQLDAHDPIALVDTVAPEAPAVLLYTSGTTGRPKGALLSHGNLEAGIAALNQAWGWTRDDVLLHALPLFHVHGLFVAQHGALRAGATSVWMARFEPRAAIEHMQRDGITVFMGVPTFYNRFLALPDSRVDLPHMRLFTSGSAPLPAADHHAFLDRFGHAILERYGMTEVGIVLSNPLHGIRRPGAVGLALPGVQARVTDTDTGEPVEQGVIGEIRIAGQSVFAGYLGLPDASAAALEDGWMHTGDLGYVDGDGYFHVVGRGKDMIISGGLNVYPSEVEARLLDHPAVLQAAVVGAPDPDLGERVVASVVVSSPVRSAELVAWCREVLAAYKCPKALQSVPALPRNSMGKIQKGELRVRWARPAFRIAGPDDLDRIVSWNLAMALETEDLALDPGTLEAGARRVLQGGAGAHYMLAEVAGVPVGQCMITVEWSDWRNAEVWWYQSVYIDQRWRRKGVFRSLHDHVSERARDAGAAGLRLYVDRTNTRAMQTYSALGMDGEHYRMFELMFRRDGPNA